MTPGQWEQYVEPAAKVMHRERFGPDIPWGDFGPVMEEMELAEARAMLDAVGPRIAEDTRDRLVAAAGEAVVREGHLNSCIWIDPGRQSGVACFGGTRVPVDPFMAIVEEAGVETARALWPSVTEAHVAAGKVWRSRYHEWLRGAR